MSRRAILLLLLALAPALAGCGDDGDGGDDPPPSTPAPDPVRITFGGQVVDARTREPIPDAEARLDLGQSRPCRRMGVLWSSWPLDVDARGRFGPLELPAPNTTEVAFFLHVSSPGHTANATFIGPAETRRGVSNLTVVLHEKADVEGRAPPGTVVALAHPEYPRFAVADANGTFRFEGARVFESAWVAATEPPVLGRVAAPGAIEVEAQGGPVWRLEGTVKGPDGAGLAADVIAWNGSVLASAARSGPAGHFSLPLKPERQDLLVEARTAEGQYGGVLRVLVEGPPATRQDLLLRALC